jgi:M6 family metalloprotease-like protein
MLVRCAWKYAGDSGRYDVCRDVGPVLQRVLSFTFPIILAGLSGVAALSQERVPLPELASNVRALNEQLNQPQPFNRDLLGILRSRAALLSELIESDPIQAVSLALPAGQAAGLAAVSQEAANQIESQGEWEGPVAVFVEDNFHEKTSRTRVRMEADGEHVEVHFTARTPALVSGQTVKVRGIRLGKHMAAALAHAGPAPEAASACSPIGEQKIAILLMEFPNVPFPTSIITASELHDMYFSTTRNSLDGYWREASYGKTWPTGEVFGPFMLDKYYDVVTQLTEGSQAAINAADASVDFTVYNHVVFMWPAPGFSGWGGRGTLGCVQINSPSKGQILGTEAFMGVGTSQPYDALVGLVAHEHGHNLGLNHASSLDFSPLALGPPGAAGVYTEYGDPFSVMGGGEGGRLPGHYNAPEKAQLGWLQTGSDIQNVATAGNFKVEPYESPTGLRALRVQRGPASDKWLWLEFRQPIGYDQTLKASVSEQFSGPLIHYENPDLTQYAGHSLLLDFTPGTPHTFIDAALPAGQSWSDPFSPLSIRVNSADASGLSVAVSYGTPCVTLTSTSSNQGAGAGMGTIAVSAPSGCSWTATSNADWLTITGGQSGAGGGTVTYAVTPNTGVTTRTGVVFIGWQSFTITQATSFVNKPPSADAVAPASGAGLSQTFVYTISDPNGTSVLRNFFVWFHPTTSPTGCLFLIRLDAAQVGFQQSGGSFSQFPVGSHFALQDTFCGVDVSRVSIQTSGNSMKVTVPVVFTAKLQGDLVHIVTVTDAAGAEPSFHLGTWTVPNTPCPYSIAPAGAAVGMNATAGTVAVTTNPGCPWLASIGDFWTKVTSDVSFTGSGMVSYEIGANPVSVVRSSTMTIAGQTFTVEQEGTSVAGLTLAGSMAQLASGGGWDTTLTLVNIGTGLGEAMVNFFGNDGSRLQLPFTFALASSITGPLVGSTFDQTLNANSLLVLDSQQPGSPSAQAGAAQLLTNGNVGGFAVFKYAPTGQEAVVPLETRNAPSYVLAFDNTGVLGTGIAIANVAALPASIPVVFRDDTGAQIGTDTISLAAQGHTSFMLTGNYTITRGKRGTIELDTPVSGHISALGLRANGTALTTLPVLANVTSGGGTMAHVASGGGWQTTFTLVNAGSSSSQAQLSFFDNNGNALSLPLTFVQSGTATTASTLSQTIAAGATLVILTQGNNAGASVVGSAQLSTTGNISGFAIFRYNPTGQEAVVPLETRNANAYVLAFDNTNGLVTGLALANVSNQAVNVPVVLRGDTGASLGKATINLAALGHTAFVLTDNYTFAAGKRGTVEFDAPAGNQISVLGLRATPTSAVTTIPVLAK